jgi:hypothetical protein
MTTIRIINKTKINDWAAGSFETLEVIVEGILE